MDTKDWDGMATIFTDDAVFDARASFSIDGHGGAGRAAESNDWVSEGGANIVAFIRGAATNLMTVHHGHCHEIEILSPTDARGVIAMEDQVFEPNGGEPLLTLHGCGHYHESYRKVDGRWRIASSRITRLYVRLTPY
jgi:hypothetical protein